MRQFKNIAKIPFPGIEGGYIVISAKDAGDGNHVRKKMSFFLDGSKGEGVEWEPDYGPITRITSCDKDHAEAKPHWFYDFYTGQGNWSQMGVEEYNLPQHFIEGNYKSLFASLRAWLKGEEMSIEPNASSGCKNRGR